MRAAHFVSRAQAVGWVVQVGSLLFHSACVGTRSTAYKDYDGECMPIKQQVATRASC